VALKVDYVVKETGRNLVRSPWLTIATVLVVVVAVGLVGFSLLVREGVGNATERWRGGVEFIVYMNPDATPEQVAAVQRDLDDNPQVESYEYLDQQAAFAEFQDLFADSPELLASVTPEILPTSYKVKPVRADADVVTSLSSQFSNKAGVRAVVAANEAIRRIERVSNIFSVGIVAVAFALVAVAVVLVGNTIQTAIFARRREIEVMKLVGATNWFIRVPFMLEGVIQGILGGLAGISLVYVGNWAFDRYLASDDILDVFGNFAVPTADLLPMALLLLLGAVLITAIASAVAVTFYVNV
jgi:cell division transport system permease protein